MITTQRTFVTLALTAGLALGMTTASAQQRYTFKALSKPASTSNCQVNHIDANGVVLGSCLYWTGRLYFPGGYPQYEMRGRPVSWSSSTGSATTLAYVSNASVDSVYGRGPGGLIYARVRALPSKGGASMGTYTLSGNTWTPWTPPSPLTGNWIISHLNSAGMLLLQSSDAGKEGQMAVVRSNLVVSPLPAYPAAAEGYLPVQAQVGSDGHVFVRTMRSADLGTSRGRNFWWNGTQWNERSAVDLAPLPQFSTYGDRVQQVQMNGRDQAVVGVIEDGATDVFTALYLWDFKTDGLQRLPAPTPPTYSAGYVSDSGTVMYSRHVPGVSETSTGAYRVVTVQNGQQLDLSTLTTLPSGVALVRPAFVSHLGRALIYTTGTKWTLGVLTPQ